MKVGIIGAGNIAKTLTKTMQQMKDVEVYAISSRSKEKAEEFRREFSLFKDYGSYEELVNDEEVEMVYIATPHSHHYEHMKLCIEHKKAVLCEKAFTFNSEEAREIAELAREKQVYVAEAIWTRYMPSRKIIDEVISSGIVGKISMMTCNLAYDIDDKERIIRPELAGGALLDLGVYGLNFIVMHFGKNIERMDVSVVKTETGVDGKLNISLIYKDKFMAVSTHGIYGCSDKKGIFYGEKGYIVVNNINNPESIDVFDDKNELIKHISFPEKISGYEYQITETVNCIREGKLESSSMPLSESVYMMELMDEIKKKF
nr:Gfo/Idh/MocA family oxidoreductase [uncultured Catonella sp.]